MGKTEKTGIYDPTDEYSEIDDTSDILGIGEGRRKTLAAIDAKNSLDDPVSFGSLRELTNAVREISLAHPDGRTYMGVPEDAIDAIEAAYNDLPDDAQAEYLNDRRLYVKIRAARNRFNDWMGKKRREQEIPSSMEAGPSNYPSKKAKKTSEYARDGREDLTEALDKVRSAARGAKQRALEAVGSSVAEQNEQKAEEKREERRETFEKGDLAFYSDTQYGNALWGVKRVNKKSVRLRRPHGSAGMEKPMSDGETYPEYDETRADLDSNRLKGPVPPEKIAAFDADDAGPRTSSDSIAIRADTAAEARRLAFGDKWADKHLDDDTEMSDTNSDDEHAGMWDCIEAENSKRLTYRATGDEHVTHIEILECETCGRRYVGETEYGDEVGEMVDFGYSDVDEILDEYGLESDTDFPPARRPDDDTEEVDPMTLSADDLQREYPGLNTSPAKALADEYDSIEAIENDLGGLGDVSGVGPASVEAIEAHADPATESDETGETAIEDAWVVRFGLNNALSEYGHHDPTRRAFTSWVRENDENLDDALVNRAFDIGPKNFNFASWATENVGEEENREKVRVLLAWLADEHPDLLADAEERRAEEKAKEDEKAQEAEEKRERAERLLADAPDVAVNGWKGISADYFTGASIDAEVALLGWPRSGYPSVLAIHQDETGMWRGGEYIVADLLANDGDLRATGANRRFGMTPDSREEAAEALIGHTKMGPPSIPDDGYPLDEYDVTVNGWAVYQYEVDDARSDVFELQHPESDAFVRANDAGEMVVDGSTVESFDSFGEAVDAVMQYAVENQAAPGDDPTSDDGGPYDPTTEFTTETQGTLDAGVDAEEVAEEKQVTLGGGDLGADPALPAAWTADGSREEASRPTTFTAGPYNVRVQGGYPGPYDVVLSETGGESLEVATNVAEVDVAAEVAERFTEDLAPDDVSFHSSDSAPMEAAAEAKQAISEASDGGLSAFTGDGTTGVLDADDRARVKSKAEAGSLRPLLSAAGVQRGKMTRNVRDAVNDTVEGLINYSGDFADIDHVSQRAAAGLEEAQELAADAIIDNQDGTPAMDQPWLDELDGIGSSTYEDLMALGLSNIGDAKEAYANRANSDTWQEALNTAPSKEGRESLLEAVGADPEATVAEDMEQADDGGLLSMVPDAWTVEEESGDRVELQHQDGISAEIWATESGEWDAEYEMNGTRRDGTGSFMESAEEAAAAMFPHIKEMRAEDRDRAEQQAEQERVEWPDEVGRYHLKEGTATPTNAEYMAGYIGDVTILGKKRKTDSLRVRFYDDTRTYSVDGEQYARKGPAVEAIREELEDRTEKYDDIEADVREENPEAFDYGGDGVEAAAEEAKARREGFVTEMMADLKDSGLTDFDLTENANRDVHPDDQDRPKRRAGEESMLAGIFGESSQDTGGTERPFTVEANPKQFGTATDALGMLRKDYGKRHEYLRDQGIHREDISAVVRRFNHAESEAGATSSYEVALSEDEMSVLWAATAYYAEKVGNDAGLNGLEGAMADAENAAESSEQDASEAPDTEADPVDSETPEADSGETEASESKRGTTVEFNTLDAANEWRDDHEEALHADDTRRPKTVRLAPDASEETVKDAEGAALVTFADETPNYGQEALTGDERETLENRDGWKWGRHGFEAMGVKAALLAEGASDWLNYYEKNEGVAGSLKNMEAGKQATAQKGTNNALSGKRQDDEMTQAEAARKVEKGEGQACSSAEEGCESGYQEACRELRENCGYSEDDIEALREGIEEMGEDPKAVLAGGIYDPTEDTDDDMLTGDPGEVPGPNGETGHLGTTDADDAGLSFTEWAADAAPDADVPEPSDDELAALAPKQPGADDYRPEVLERDGIEMGDGFEFEPLPTPARRVIGSAWQGYRLSRVEATEGIEKAENYAETINGVRMANGLRPLEFNELEGLAESAHVPEDPSSEYPTGDGKRSLLDAMKKGALDVVRGSVYDPTEDL